MSVPIRDSRVPALFHVDAAGPLGSLRPVGRPSVAEPLRRDHYQSVWRTGLASVSMVGSLTCRRVPRAWPSRRRFVRSSCLAELHEAHDSRAASLKENGFVHLPRVFPAEDARSILDMLWQDYDQKHAVSRFNPRGWFTKTGSGKRLYGPPATKIKMSDSYKHMVACMHAAVEEVLAPDAWRMGGKGNTTVFVNCPNKTNSWTVPVGWHTDMPLNREDTRPSVIYAFTLLDQLEPQGGSTMILSGASRRAQLDDVAHFWSAGNAVVETRSRRFMEALVEEDEWFADLFGPKPLCSVSDYRYLCNPEIAAKRVQRFMEDGTNSAGVPMRVTELLGSAGDVVLWDPRCLHSSSNNVRNRPRSVIRFRYDRAI